MIRADGRRRLHECGTRRVVIERASGHAQKNLGLVMIRRDPSSPFERQHESFFRKLVRLQSGQERLRAVVIRADRPGSFEKGRARRFIARTLFLQPGEDLGLVMI